MRVISTPSLSDYNESLPGHNDHADNETTFLQRKRKQSPTLSPRRRKRRLSDQRFLELMENYVDKDEDDHAGERDNRMSASSSSLYHDEWLIHSDNRGSSVNNLTIKQDAGSAISSHAAVYNELKTDTRYHRERGTPAIAARSTTPFRTPTLMSKSNPPVATCGSKSKPSAAANTPFGSSLIEELAAAEEPRKKVQSGASRTNSANKV